MANGYDDVRQIAIQAGEIAFWRFQAVWHRAARTHGIEPSEAQLQAAQQELEELLASEREERFCG